jgi:hypothetical protein
MVAEQEAKISVGRAGAHRSRQQAEATAAADVAQRCDDAVARATAELEASHAKLQRVRDAFSSSVCTHATTHHTPTRGHVHRTPAIPFSSSGDGGSSQIDVGLRRATDAGVNRLVG